MAVYSFEGWNAHQSLGMLLTRRMETRADLKPIGFVANDYALACWSVEPYLPILRRCSVPIFWRTSFSTG